MLILVLRKKKKRRCLLLVSTIFLEALILLVKGGKGTWSVRRKCIGIEGGRALAFGFPPEHTSGGPFKAAPQGGVLVHTLNPSAGRLSRWIPEAHMSATLEFKAS